MTSAIRLTSLSRPVNILFLLLLVGAMILAAFNNLAVILPLVIISVAFVAWTYQRTELWLFFAILFHGVFYQLTEGITIQEVLFGIYFMGFMGFWFVKRIVLGGQPLVRDPAGGRLIAFLIICVLSIVVGLLSRAVVFLWFREIIAMSVLFVYFPAREALKTDRGRKLALAGLMLLTAGLAIYNIAEYSSTALAAKIYSGLLGKRQPVGGYFFFSTTVITGAVWVHSLGDGRFRVFNLAVFGLALAGLIATFTRGFWIVSLLAMFILFVFAEPRKRVALIIGASAVMLAGVAVLLVFWGALGQAVLTSVVGRFLSSGEALQDVSVTNRLAESAAILKVIAQSPVLGHGFGSSFRYLDLIKTVTIQTWYSHNGYLFLLFKVGIVGTIVFLAFYGKALMTGYRLSKTLPVGHELRPFVHAIWAILASFLVVTLTSNVFIEREALLIIGLGAAFMMNVRDLTEKGGLPHRQTTTPDSL